MCKIDGHSLGTWLFQPVWNWKKLHKKGNAAQTKKMKQETLALEKQNEELSQHDSGDMSGELEPMTPMAAPQAVPVSTQGTGINNLSKIGLNL